MGTIAQKKIELSLHKPYHTEVRLCDYNKTDDDFLLNLPIAFQITSSDMLIIMVGNDDVLDDKQCVWMFSEEMNFADLMKKNRNVNATKTFKSKNTTCNPVLVYHQNITLHRTFDDGYEIVKKNAKPILFEISNLSSNKSLKFSLQFYVTQPDGNYPYVFFAKCKPIEIELIIKR